eukprot:scaffold11770_cov55-Attheya_sp.AAC.1
MEIEQLKRDIRRIGPTHPNPAPHVLFGELFEDEEVEQFYEALVGTLKSAKKRGVIVFRGQILLKGMHDREVISIVSEMPPPPMTLPGGKGSTNSHASSSSSSKPLPRQKPLKAQDSSALWGKQTQTKQQPMDQTSNRPPTFQFSSPELQKRDEKIQSSPPLWKQQQQQQQQQKQQNHHKSSPTRTPTPVPAKQAAPESSSPSSGKNWRSGNSSHAVRSRSHTKKNKPKIVIETSSTMDDEYDVRRRTNRSMTEDDAASISTEPYRPVTPAAASNKRNMTESHTASAGVLASTAAAPAPAPAKGSRALSQQVSQRVDQEIQQLLHDISRVGSEPGQPHVLFGELFDDDDVQQYYEALVGTLKSAKRRGFITFKGQMLLKGMHDNVPIYIVPPSK